MILKYEELKSNYELFVEINQQLTPSMNKLVKADSELICIEFIPNKDYENEKELITSTIVRVTQSDLNGYELKEYLGGFNIKGYDKNAVYLGYTKEQLDPNNYLNLVQDIKGVLLEHIE